MKMIHEMRERQAWEQQKTAGPLPIILGAVIAFGIGLLGVSGAIRAPTLLQAKTQMVPVAPRDGATAGIRIDTSSQRIGRAETAPLLKLCVPFSRLGFEHVDRVPPGDLYRILQTASGFSRIASVAGVKQNAVDEAQFAAVWGDVADCIYRQNGWMLCDPDNRALAVEAATTLVRQLSTAVKADKQSDAPDGKRSATRTQERAYALRNAHAIKTRVLASLRTHASERRLIASDFGLFTPSEIAQIIRETKVTRDACAARN
ncbi:MAG: hypothetical protein AB7V13_13555 [Pseudorhodoplanes sp.]|uniref:hypothetical protein n=1 Tax=Pseudorhodoplanes sp. TaxID=1934341 RepID=UPI003D0E524E